MKPVHSGCQSTLARLYGALAMTARRWTVRRSAHILSPCSGSVSSCMEAGSFGFERERLDSINAAAAKVGPAIDRFRPVVDRAVVVVERTGVLIQSVNRVTATA